MATPPAKPVGTKTNAAKAAVKAPVLPSVTTDDMMHDAPTKGKYGLYFKLKGDLKRFQPKVDVLMTLIFLPWVPGKMHKRHGVSPLVTSAIFHVHDNVGPNDMKVLCPHTMFERPCPNCMDFQQRKILVPRGDKKGWDAISGMRAKSRELFFVHDLFGDSGNLQVWDESCFLFGDYLRKKIAMREKYKALFDLTKGLKVIIRGEKKSLGQGGGDCNVFSSIEIEDRDGPLPQFLIDSALSYRIDECLVETPHADMKKLLASTGGAKAAVEEEITENPPEEEPAPVEEQLEAEVPAEEVTEKVTEKVTEEVTEEEQLEAEVLAEEVTEEPVEEEEIIEEEVVEEEAPAPPPPARPATKPAAPRPAAPAARPVAPAAPATATKPGVAKPPVRK